MALDTLINLSWRLYLALPLMAAGAAGAVWGVRRGFPGLLGAVRGDSTRLVPFMEGFRATMIGLALIGVAIGLGAAFALTRWLETFLFEVRPTDLLTYASIALLLIFVALLACWLPARRATKVDPLLALRYE